MKTETILERAKAIQNKWEQDTYLVKNLQKKLKTQNVQEIKDLLAAVSPGVYGFSHALSEEKENLTGPVVDVLLEDFQTRFDEYAKARFSMPYFLLTQVYLEDKGAREKLVNACREFFGQDFTPSRFHFPLFLWESLAHDPEYAKEIASIIPWDQAQNSNHLSTSFLEQEGDLVTAVFKEILPHWSDHSVVRMMDDALDLVRRKLSHEYFAKRASIATSRACLLGPRFHDIVPKDQIVHRFYANVSCVEDETAKKTLEGILNPLFKNIPEETKNDLDVSKSTPRGVLLAEEGVVTSLTEKGWINVLDDFVDKRSVKMSQKGLEKLLESLSSENKEKQIERVLLRRTYNPVDYKGMAWLVGRLSSEQRLKIVKKIFEETSPGRRLVSLLIKDANVDDLKKINVPHSFYKQAPSQEWLDVKVIKKSKKELKETMVTVVKASPKKETTPKRKM